MVVQHGRRGQRALPRRLVVPRRSGTRRRSSTPSRGGRPPQHAPPKFLTVTGPPWPSGAHALRLHPPLRRRLALHGHREESRAPARPARRRSGLALYALPPAGRARMVAAGWLLAPRAPGGAPHQGAPAGREGRAGPVQVQPCPASSRSTNSPAWPLSHVPAGSFTAAGPDSADDAAPRLEGCGQTRRLLKKAQLRGGARGPRARRTPCSLSVRPRAPTKQMGLFQQPAGSAGTITRGPAASGQSRPRVLAGTPPTPRQSAATAGAGARG